MPAARVKRNCVLRAIMCRALTITGYSCRSACSVHRSPADHRPCIFFFFPGASSRLSASFLFFRGLARSRRLLHPPSAAPLITMWRVGAHSSAIGVRCGASTMASACRVAPWHSQARRSTQTVARVFRAPAAGSPLATVRAAQAAAPSPFVQPRAARGLHQWRVVSTSSPSTGGLAATSATDPQKPSQKPKRFTLKTLRYDLRQAVFQSFPWVREWGSLVKAELSLVVTMSSFFGCMMAGSDAWSTPHVLANFAGTAMCAASAAIINQYMEVPYDAQMPRTASRPLVTGAISVPTALTAAALLPIGGAALLHFASAGDWVAPVLGIGTIIGYTCFYTPMKRLHRWNTEFGAIVGSVPVLIGWSCAISHWTHHMTMTHAMHLPFTTLMSLTMPHALYGFFFLVAWQMQHFMTIAYQFQEQYARAGYVMMRGDAALHKGMAWTAILCAMPFVGVQLGVASQMLMITGSAINGLLVWTYYNWYRTMRSTTDETKRNLAARSCMLWGIIYFFLMFGATIYHSLDNKYHLFTNLVPASIRQVALSFCPWPHERRTIVGGHLVTTSAQQIADHHANPNPHVEPCHHQHTQNDRKCIYMRLVKQETLDQLEPKRAVADIAANVTTTSK